MQDFRAWYPPFEHRSESFPPFACSLTATCECLVPQSIDALTEGSQLSDVAWHCVVLVIHCFVCFLQLLAPEWTSPLIAR
jgi:hypothetical protein